MEGNARTMGSIHEDDEEEVNEGIMLACFFSFMLACSLIVLWKELWGFLGGEETNLNACFT